MRVCMSCHATSPSRVPQSPCLSPRTTFPVHAVSCLRSHIIRPALTTTAPGNSAAVVPSHIKVPRSIADVDNGKILGFGANLAEDHPGFHDTNYKQRRTLIAEMARMHELGQPLPEIAYTPEETAVWGKAIRELQGLFPKYASREFNQSFNQMGFKEDEVPQLQRMSELLQASTGWSIRPVAGLMHPRDFLAGLAFKTFHSTQYVRHSSRPDYTPEPDVCHELIGHVPMLANPAYAELVHTIGVASLGADDRALRHLTRVYWFTVEFGVVMEEGEPKAFGAGILSSFGEMQHMAAGKAELKAFDPFAPQPKMSYKDGFQQAYFALESFQDAASKIQALAATISSGQAFKG
mmetsp:Transcript_228/g.361  ORF Transcript_228/g.361 Transcript_228/m.361 type:complete len:350 (+) Transcript_228:198-1247(+)